MRLNLFTATYTLLAAHGVTAINLAGLNENYEGPLDLAQIYIDS